MIEANRTYVYVDGESHFIRSERAWRNIHGPEACLQRLKHIGQADEKLVLVDSTAKVFWTQKMNPGVDRAYYFTSVVGDETAEHELKVALRNFGLEPSIVRELKQLADRRRNELDTLQLIEKPKMVDIALAVRLLEDVNAFDTCHLYTSDVDFLPVIQAVRGRWKRVFVHGYKDGLSSKSPFYHACDQFFDLEEMLRDQCELHRAE